MLRNIIWYIFSSIAIIGCIGAFELSNIGYLFLDDSTDKTRLKLNQFSRDIIKNLSSFSESSSTSIGSDSEAIQSHMLHNYDKVNNLNAVKRETELTPKNCEGSSHVSVFSNFLRVSKNEPQKEQLLKEFLCIKYFQHYDIISYMAIDEFRTSFSFRILKNSFEKKSGNFFENIKKHGVDMCDLESVANQNTEKIVSICPWHWVIIKREDRYPFQLPIARCNCVHCLAKTSFDSDRYKRSRCNPNYSLLPVLIKEPNDSTTDEEVWKFNLEEVPFSCSCNIKINPF